MSLLYMTSLKKTYVYKEIQEVDFKKYFKKIWYKGEYLWYHPNGKIKQYFFRHSIINLPPLFQLHLRHEHVLVHFY